MKAIKKANSAIPYHSDRMFEPKYNETESKISFIENTELENYLKGFTSKNKQKLKLILHAGTPKTGSTSLQFFLYEKSNDLKKNGIIYNGISENSSNPKHQWIVESILNEDEKQFCKKISNVLSIIDDKTHTIILSTEGIYNHWHDFSIKGKSFFYTLSKYFDTEFWVWFREPISFFESLYVQILKNPRIKKIPCYGRNISVKTLIQDNWFIKHFDYRSFVVNVQEIGNIELKIFEYNEGETIKSFIDCLGVNIECSNIKLENKRFSVFFIYILRLINTFNIDNKKKKLIVKRINKINEYIPFFKYRIRGDNRIFLKKLMNSQMEYLKNNFSMFKNYN